MGVPDRRDTVGIGKSTMGGVASRGLQTLTNTVLGTLIGAANVVLTTLNLPPYTPTGTVASAISNFLNLWLITNGSAEYNGGTQPAAPSSQNTPTITSSFAGVPQGGTSTPVNNVQPSTTCNYIIRLG
jgi:microcystin-dependent protein